MAMAAPAKFKISNPPRLRSLSKEGKASMKMVITGGAGFIGSSAANYFAVKGHEVVLLDDLSSPGSASNLDRLRMHHPGLQFVEGDVRGIETVESLLLQHAGVDVVLHLAARRGASASAAEPRADFEVNALGTLNTLEAVRNVCPGAFLVFSSTNKVYGSLDKTELIEKCHRWELRHPSNGVCEDQPLELSSPYACSKGAGDQYVRSYARTYGLSSVILRLSSVYGPHQFGTEENGWVAWFTIAAALGKPITIFGDGKQMRDILFIDDFLVLLDRTIEMRERTKGQVFNIGGGPRNTLSVRELLRLLRELTEREVEIDFGPWRAGDQPVYVSDITKAQETLLWEPRVAPRQGIRRLYRWVLDNQDLF